MKPRADFDPMFEAGGRRGYRAIRSIGASLTAVVLSGMALRAGPIPSPRPAARALQVAPMPGGRVAAQGSVQIPRAGVGQPPDRYVLVAPASIDPKMVVRARDDIDPEMVFNPDARRRGSTPSDPAPAVLWSLPGPVPAPVPSPAPGDLRPRR